MSEEVEIPDTSYEVLDRAAMTLLKADLGDLSRDDHHDLDILVSQLLMALFHRADKIADLSLIPGKVADSVLAKTLAGYAEAKNLADFIESRLGEASQGLTPGPEVP